MRRIPRGAVVAQAAVLALVALGPSAPARAAEPLGEDLLEGWYYTEVVVFLRPDVHDYASEERLTGAAAPLVRSLRIFRLPPEQRWDGYRLAPLARAFLSFPYLDASRLDLFTEPRGEQGPHAAGAEAAEERWGRDAIDGRPPPDIEPRLRPDPLLDFLRDLAAFEATLARNSYRPLEPDTFVLAAHARALARRGGYRVLLHRRWLQPVPPRDAPEPLFVQAGPRYGDTFALEGTFDVTRGRYLHVGAHLLYREPLLGRAPIDRALPPPGSTSVPGLPSPRLSLDDLQPAGFLQLRENRRVNEENVSYFDHPKLGVLVKVEPVVPPAGLVSAYQALKDEG